MKPIFTAIFFFFFSTVAYTGHPDKDPVVNHLRSQFEEARVPSEDDLRLGENILCLQYYAAPGHYKVLQFPGLHNFRKVGGIIFHNNGSSLFKSFLIREQGLVGRTTSYIMTYRVTEDGDLIGEWAFSNDDLSKSSDLARSSVYSDYFLSSYLLCPLE